MREINYQKYVKERRKLKAIYLSDIIKNKDGIWLNESDFNGTTFICRIKCSFNHTFTMHSRSISRGNWCPNCTGNIYIGETISRIVLEELLGYSLEKTRRIPGLIDSDTKRNLEIDGYNEKNKMAFEYQGFHHEKYVPYIHHKESAYVLVKKRDIFKREFCLKNGIKLLEIFQLQSFNPEIVIYQLKKMLENNNIKYYDISEDNIINKIKIQLSSGIFYEKVMKYLIENKMQVISGNFRIKTSRFILKMDGYDLTFETTLRKIIDVIDTNNKEYFLKKFKKINILKVKKEREYRWNIDIAKEIIKECKNTKELKKNYEGLHTWLRREGIYHLLTKNLERLPGKYSQKNVLKSPIK